MEITLLNHFWRRRLRTDGWMDGGSRGEGEKKGLWLRRVPIMVVADLYLKRIIKGSQSLPLKWWRENKGGVKEGGGTGKRC